MNTLELGKNSSSKFYGICMKFVIYLFVFIGLSSSYAGSYEDYFSAVKRDDGVGISALLARGFDGNVLDPKGDHALLVALRDKSLKAVSALLDWGKINVEPRSKADESPLMLASLEGQLEIARRLIAMGAETSTSRAGRRCITRQRTAMWQSCICCWTTSRISMPHHPMEPRH